MLNHHSFIGVLYHIFSTNAKLKQPKFTYIQFLKHILNTSPHQIPIIAIFLFLHFLAYFLY